MRVQKLRIAHNITPQQERPMAPDEDAAMRNALTRRRLLSRAVSAAFLPTFGILPAGCDSRWALLPPRPVDWTMKPLSSAKVSERVFADGHIELTIEHALLHGVTPAMLVWWWRNIEGEMELKGEEYPRYLIWHPIDHIHFAVAERLADGSVGVGSTLHVVEALGADMRHLVDVLLHL